MATSEPAVLVEDVRQTFGDVVALGGVKREEPGLLGKESLELVGSDGSSPPRR